MARRDHMLSEIAFNEGYGDVYEQTQKNKSGLRVKRFLLAEKQRLLPLEKLATPAAELKAIRCEKDLAAIREKQRLPRMAIEQKYLRLRAKQGEERAQSFRKGALSRLDAALESRENALRLCHEQGGEEGANREAKARYEARLAEHEARMEAFEGRCERACADQCDTMRQRLNAKNEKLRQRAQGYAKKIEHISGAKRAAMQDADSVLEVTGLTMRFGGLTAVDDLAFQVKRGEIFGLIGPNGAGKTTVFNCITRFYKPNAGKLLYRSKNGDVIDLTNKRVHDVVKTGIVRTFQNVELIWELSVLDNLLIGAHTLYGTGLFAHLLHTPRLRHEEQVMKARALGILEQLELIQYKDVPPLGLPYGILKKVELARTLMIRPQLIILDEPAAGLNDAETEALADTIKNIRDAYDCTIFLVEHDMSLIMTICDKVCAINFGKLLAVGTPHEIQGNPHVQEAYLGCD